MSGVVTRRLRIHGRVQGVWYRGWAVDTARALGLDGWVRNRSDSSVELVARGPEAALDALAGQCRQGPPSARVDRIEVEEAASEEVPEGFDQRPTL